MRSGKKEKVELVRILPGRLAQLEQLGNMPFPLEVRSLQGRINYALGFGLEALRTKIGAPPFND